MANFLKKITSSITGMFFGIILFLGSFVILFINEGRDDLSKIAQDAQVIQADQQYTGDGTSLVVVEGKRNTDEFLTDKYIKTGKYITLNRFVEMYAWKENKKTTEDDDGNEKTTYFYEKIWTNKPSNSSEFNKTSGHKNPPISLNSFSQKVNQIKIGNYKVLTNGLSLPSTDQLKLNYSLTNLNQNSTGKNQKIYQNKYIFSGVGSLDGPKIGDIRISYNVVKPNKFVSIFGQIQGNEIVPNTTDNNEFYRAFYGNKNQALKTMHKEYKQKIWIFRIIGFLLMWIGLNMILGLIRTLFNFVPILGQITGGILTIATGITAFVLSLITILIGLIFHSWIALIILVIIVGGIIIYQYKYAKKKSPEIPNKKDEKKTEKNNNNKSEILENIIDGININSNDNDAEDGDD